MDRKESIKTLVFGSLSLPFLTGNDTESETSGRLNPGSPMRSRWNEWPDMPWAGPAFWGNRLQDWHVTDGVLECRYSGNNRNIHCLTHQLGERFHDFKTGVDLELLNRTGNETDYAGFRLGGKAGDYPCSVTFVDYRRAAVFGEGLDAGITTAGRLFIGETKSDSVVPDDKPVRLVLEGRAKARSYELVLSAIDPEDQTQIQRLTLSGVDADKLTGNLALVSHVGSENQQGRTPSARFSDWQISGDKVDAFPGQVYGPILFAQYTLHRETVKMTAQLTPVETIAGHNVQLQIREEGSWKTVQETTVDALSRTAQFRIDEWRYSRAVPYRVRLVLPLREKTEEFFYEGTIAAEPVDNDRVKAAVFSCNQQFGFPDTEVVRNVKKHNPDLAFFLGDQFYEAFGGFGVERSHDLEMSTLDYLRKWYMFGWSYREIWRHIPALFIPDDHDVFQGNIWGQGGKAADISDGFAPDGQDTGGYTMLPEWVRMVERTQTSHLPNPYDPTRVGQGIGVYYTDWTYAGISFGILEDRKFKTAPGNVLPVEVINGFAQDTEFDFTHHYDIDADLLGERQEKFLEEWVADWSEGVQWKVVLSQSPFCGAHTMAEGATHDRMVPQRPIPPRGEYPAGDVPAPDMDTNGWPQKKRDKALRILRKGFALHLAGDQHLASMIRYGVDEFGDSGYVYTLPALNNTWPRRWWPAVAENHQPLPGRPGYTGNFKDAFGNRLTVLSVANPVQTNRKPAIMYDRATGYGIACFDKKNRTVRLECWPRYTDPIANPEGQYDGWPVTIRQEENYNRKAAGYLPEFVISGLERAVMQLFDQDSGELIYTLRLKKDSIRPKVFQNRVHRVRVGDPDRNRWQEYENLTMDRAGEQIRCNFGG